MENDNRVVVLIDMDCFYCQVEEKLDPDLKGKPIAVVQYNPWKGGGIIAVNYVARAAGVTRHMRGDQAKEKCPEISLPSVPCVRGKADISKYREAGKEVARVLQKFTPLLERASIDEAYLDITESVVARSKTLSTTSITESMIPNTFALGYDSINDFLNEVNYDTNESVDYDGEHARRLLAGAVIVSEVRKAVYDETGYQCSAGIAHNKILAKLVCGMNKPNKQTILAKHSINLLYSTLSLKKVKHLGGKFGDAVCSTLKISKMGELQKFRERELQKHFDEKNGTWLYNIARGIDTEQVQAKFSPKSIGCCKNFKGKNALTDLESLTKWLKDLGDEIEERLDKDALENNRTPKQMVVSYALQFPNGKDVSSSRSYNFAASDVICGEFLGGKALEIFCESNEIPKNCDGETKTLKMPVKFLGISVGKFEDHSDKKIKTLNDYFGARISTAKEENNKIDGNLEKIKKTKAKEEERKALFERFFKSDAQVNDNGTEDVNTDGRQLQNEEEISNEAKVSEDESNDSTEQFTSENKVFSEDNTESRADYPSRSNSPIISNLNNQESFFRKFLQEAIDKKIFENDNKPSTSRIEPPLHPTTPVCDVIRCQDDDNSSNYSGSTIEMEINQSRNIFEDSPEDFQRVTDTRKLMSTSLNLDKNESPNDEIEALNVDKADNDKKSLIEAALFTKELQNINELKENMFYCKECNKKVYKFEAATHADYHLALKLREEERAERRNQFVSKTIVKSKTPAKVSKKQKVDTKENRSNIKNFFSEFDDIESMQKCKQCGAKILIEKFSEHLDFHEAQKLFREINRKPVVMTQTNTTVSGKSTTVSEKSTTVSGKNTTVSGKNTTVSGKNTTVSGKRKRNSSPTKKPKVKCRSIDTFFC